MRKKLSEHSVSNEIFVFWVKNPTHLFIIYQMDISQQSAIDVHKPELCKAFGTTTEAFLFGLQVKGILSPEEIQTIRCCP